MRRSFSNFLDQLTKKIYYIPARRRVKKELMDHMVQKRKDLCEIYSWTEATDIVITEMGDVKELSSSFNKIYSPLKYYLSLLLSVVLVSMIGSLTIFITSQSVNALSNKPKYVSEKIILDETYFIDDTRVKFTYAVILDGQTLIHYKVDDEKLFKLSYYSLFDTPVYNFLDPVEAVTSDVSYTRDNFELPAGIQNYNIFYTEYFVIIPDIVDEVTLYFSEYDRSLEVPLSWTIED